MSLLQLRRDVFPFSLIVLVSVCLSLFIAVNVKAKEVDSLLTENESMSSKSTQKKQYTLPAAMLEQLMSNMVWLEAGSFEMGSNSPEARKRERPAHQVSLDGFYMSKFELTQDIFEQIMGWNYSYFACSDCPVNNISWLNMQLFIERLNLATGKYFRLPTEAEWAYAAKGGNQSKGYTFSGSNNIADVAWYAENANKRSHPVGKKQPNELGLYDMTGNLWEFCQDDMSRVAYTNTSSVNPLYSRTNNPKQKSMKVIRGSGYEFAANESEIFKRDGATNNVRLPDIGFRLAMSKK